MSEVFLQPLRSSERWLVIGATAMLALAACSLQGFDDLGNGTATAGTVSTTPISPTGGSGGGSHLLDNKSGASGTGGGAGGAGGVGMGGTEPDLPVYSDAGVGQNIILDPGLELALLDGWSCWGGCTIQLNQTISCYGGSQCLHATDRNEYWKGPAYDIRDLVQRGRFYGVSVQVATNEPASLKLTLKRRCAEESASTFSGLFAGGSAENQNWLEFSGNFTVPNCELLDLTILLESTTADIDIFVDDLYVTLLE